jgi:hypothetical protein
MHQIAESSSQSGFGVSFLDRIVERVHRLDEGLVLLVESANADA